MTPATDGWMRRARFVLRVLAFALFYVSLSTAGTLLIGAAWWNSNMRPTVEFTVTREFALWAGLLCAVLNVETWMCFRAVMPRLERPRDLLLVTMGVLQGLIVLLVVAGQDTQPSASEYAMGSALLLGSIVMLDIVRRNAGVPMWQKRSHRSVPLPT